MAGGAITSSDHENSAHLLLRALKQPENSGGRAAETATQGSPSSNNTDDQKSDAAGLPVAWSRLATEVWQYENARVKRWKDEINTLLLFAGLFSAILTAFASQYYTLIQLGPANFNTMILERQTQIFERMASQLANSTVGAIVQVSDTPAMTADTLADPSPSLSLPPFPPRWVATLWFVSLVFSLAAASIALTVNQWLNFHAEQAGLQTAAQKLWAWRLRRQALNRWKVEFIVSLLPLLLQIALVLFLVGIIGYLGQVGADVSGPSMVCISILFLFLIATSILPALVEYSPYKSPQALWILRAVWWLKLRGHRWQNKRKASRQSPPFPNDLPGPLDQPYQEMKTPNWLSHEQLCLRGTSSKEAEKTLFSDLYSISSDPNILREMQTCLGDISASIATENARAIGNARIRVLPRGSTEDLQYDVLDRRLTTAISRVVLGIFIRKLIRDSDDPSPLEDLTNCYVVTTLFRAMPTSDAKDLQLSLFRLLDPQTNAKIITDLLGYSADEAQGGSIKIRKNRKLQRNLVNLIHAIFLPKNLFDVSKPMEDGFPFLPFKDPDWICMKGALSKTAFSRKPKDRKPGDHKPDEDDRDYAALIHVSSILVVIAYGCTLTSNKNPLAPKAGNYIYEILRDLENDLAAWVQENMGTASDRILYRQVAEASSTWYSIISAVAKQDQLSIQLSDQLNILQSFNRIARRLQWLLISQPQQGEVSQGLQQIVEITKCWANDNKHNQNDDWETPIECASNKSDDATRGGGQTNNAQTSPYADNPGGMQNANREIRYFQGARYLAHIRKALGQQRAPLRHDPEALPGSTGGRSNPPDMEKPPPLQKRRRSKREPGPSGDHHGRADTPQHNTRQDGAGASNHMNQGEATSEPSPEGTGSENERREKQAGPEGETDRGELVAPQTAAKAVVVEGAVTGASASDVNKVASLTGSAKDVPLQGVDSAHVAVPQEEATGSQDGLRTADPGPSGDHREGAGTRQDDIREDGVGTSDHVRQGEATSGHSPEGTGSEIERRGEPEGDMDHGERVAGSPAASTVAEDGAVRNGDSTNDSPGSG